MAAFVTAIRRSFGQAEDCQDAAKLGVVGQGRRVAASLPGGIVAAQAQTSLDARVVAINIPGASAIAQIGTFLSDVAQGA